MLAESVLFLFQTDEFRYIGNKDVFFRRVFKRIFHGGFIFFGEFLYLGFFLDG